MNFVIVSGDREEVIGIVNSYHELLIKACPSKNLRGKFFYDLRLDVFKECQRRMIGFVAFLSQDLKDRSKSYKIRINEFRDNGVLVYDRWGRSAYRLPLDNFIQKKLVRV